MLKKIIFYPRDSDIPLLPLSPLSLFQSTMKHGPNELFSFPSLSSNFNFVVFFVSVNGTIFYLVILTRNQRNTLICHLWMLLSE